MTTRQRYAFALAGAITGACFLALPGGARPALGSEWIDPSDPTGMGNDPNAAMHLNGNFSDPTHWDSGVPGPADNASFDVPGYPFLPFTVTLTGSPSVNQVSVINNPVTFNLAGLILSATQTTYDFNDASIFIGDRSSLTVQNGTVLAQSVQVGSATSSDGGVTLLSIDATHGSTAFDVADTSTVANYQEIDIKAGAFLQLGANVTVNQAPDLGGGGVNGGQIVITGVNSGLFVGDGTTISGGFLHVNDGFVSFTGNSATLDSLTYDGDLNLSIPGFTLTMTSSLSDPLTSNIIPTVVTGNATISDGELHIASALVEITPDGGTTWHPLNIVGTATGLIEIANLVTGDLVMDGDNTPAHHSTTTIDPSLVTVHGDLYVGNYGNATLNIVGDGNVIDIDGEMNVGFHKGSVGNVLITGQGTINTALNIPNGSLGFGDFVVGRLGTGNMTIAAGAAVTVNDPSWAFVGQGDNGDGTGGVGTLTIDGASLAGPGVTVQSSLGVSNGELYIGTDAHSHGTLNITNGGFVYDNDGHIGNSATSVGIVTVDGSFNNPVMHTVSPSQWLNNGYLTVGDSGTGNLTIRNGGMVNDTSGSVGDATGSTGTVIVDNGTWSNSAFITVGNVGAGFLTVENHGSVTATSMDMAFSAGSNSLVTVNNATMTLSDFVSIGEGSTGNLQIQNGGNVSIGSSLTLGATMSGIGTVVLDGPSSKLSDVTFTSVGNLGQGFLTVQNGAVFSSPLADGFVGDGATGIGNVTVTGNNSAWTMHGLTVGGSGNGTLSILNGGNVTLSSSAFVGSNGGATGTVMVSGAGSLWSVGAGLVIGSAGNGNLTIQNGGVVNVAIASTFISGNVASTNSNVLVTGVGSQFNNAVQLIIGTDGNGNMTISAGGLVTCAPGASPSGTAGGVGEEGASVGSLTITGPGSQLLATGHFVVGIGNNTVGTTSGGNGTLLISAGGLLSSVNGYVGRWTGSVGAVTIGGANSLWQNSGSLFIAANDTANNPGHVVISSGSGCVTLNTGGTLSAAVSTLIGPAGKLTLAGGALISPVITSTGNITGNGTLTGNLTSGGILNTPGGSIINLSGNYTENPGGSMSGTGTLIANALFGNVGTINGLVQVRSNGTSTGTSKLSALALAGTAGHWTGALDLTNNKLIVEDSATHAATLATLKDQVNFGRTHAAGVFSSMLPAKKVVALADNALAGLANFGGSAVNNTDILVTETFPGDTNFDGLVNITDLNTLAAHWQQHVADWSQGDFNGDGIVNISDLNSLAANWQAGVGGGSADESFTQAFASAL